MKTLLIETSTERGIVTFFEDEDILFHRELPFGHSSAQHLLPAIAEGLTQLTLSITDFDEIAVGIGPGSYTGIRVGVSVARTLAYASQIPLVGICSLEGFIPEKDGPFTSLIDAKMSGVYMLSGSKQDGLVSFLHDPESCSIEKFSDKIGVGTQLVTPNKNRIATLLNGSWVWYERYPCPLTMIKTGRRRDPSEIMYLRKTQAELDKDSKE